MGAVLVQYLQDDVAQRAGRVAVCEGVGDIATRNQQVGVLGRREVRLTAIPPVDAVQGGGIHARIDHRADVEGIDAAFIDRGRAGNRHRRCHVGDAYQFAGDVLEGAVLVHQIDRDGALGAAHVAVVVYMLHLAAGRQVARQEALGIAVAPVHDVLADRVGARVAHRAQGEAIGGAFRRAAVAAETEGGRHVVDGDQEAVGIRLEAVVVHRDGDVVRHGVVVGEDVLDVEIGDADADAEVLRGRAVAPVHCHVTAGRILVGRVGEADGAAEQGALVDAGIGAGIDDDDFGGRRHGDGLGASIGVGAVLVDQGDADGRSARRRVDVGDLPIRRQRSRRDDLNCSAVAPVDAVLGHCVGAGIHHGAGEVVVRPVQIQRIDLALLDGVVSGQIRQRRRHVVHRDAEAVGLDAVGLALLVVRSHRNRVAAVVGQGQADRRRTGGSVELIAAGLAAAAHPAHRHQMHVRGIGVAEGDAVAKVGALVGGAVHAGFQRRAVIDVVDGDVGEHRGSGEDVAVAAVPAEFIGTVVVRVAQVGQLVGCQVGHADHLPRRDIDAVELEDAGGGQGNDLDRRQGLALCVEETGGEEVIGQDDGGIFRAHHGDVLHLWCLVAVALQENVVGAVAVVVTVVGDEEAAIGGAHHVGNAAGAVIGIGVDELLAVHLAASRVVLLEEDFVAIRPAHHEAAVGQ
ncbi:MAG: hypothetical protein AW07_01303 [Candidatus Accumulibacter sp. SK-11]|nr:MAG: hypothetical protein AW07_01303 [Candidatus Accumulibacter sp. SK-11]